MAAKPEGTILQKLYRFFRERQNRWEKPADLDVFT
jgi:hypothetical protein